MSPAILASIRELLLGAGADFRELRHEPVTTSEEAARVRGCPLEIGAKSIVFKVDGRYLLLVMSAALGLRSGRLRRQLGVRRTRFATPEELLALTGLEPGAVPPFGEPILPLPLYVDPALLRHDEIAFTPGIHTVSIFLATRDYVRLARPELLEFAESRGPSRRPR